MPYCPLDLSTLEDDRLNKVFKNANMFLHDAYGMFRTLPPPDDDGGGGNFVIALTLLCIIDGLASEVWPGRKTESSQKKRFKRLILCKLYWGPEGVDKWAHKGTAASQLYHEFRNPLVHEMAGDKITKSRPKGWKEPLVGKWGRLPEPMREIASIDSLEIWDESWPILYKKTDEGGSQYKLATAGLYWAVKRLTKDLLAEQCACA